MHRHYNHFMPDASHRLNQLLQASGHPPLTPQTAEKFTTYLALLQKWNARTNLTAIRDQEGILSRHFLESILCAHALPAGITTLLDFGSGAGFPGIPIALIRSNLLVTLAESKNKKATFLREAVRTLFSDHALNTKVHSGRAETLNQKFDCITLRAVDKMETALPAAINLLAPTGWLALLTTREDAPNLETHATQSAQFEWQPLQPLQPETNRVLLFGQKSEITA
jgi:16S rRNA (guanine527-N7)-methyltransferase